MIIAIIHPLKYMQYNLLRQQIKIPTLFIATLLLGSCAIGNHYDYRIQSMPLPIEGKNKVGLLVIDQRAYILNGDKKPEFVGLQRGGFGNPFDVTTTSGRPMVQDMTDTLKQAMENKGFQVDLIAGDPNNLNDLGHQASLRNLHCIILLRIVEWKIDTYMKSKLLFDLKLFIINQAGVVVAQNSINGTNIIGGGMPGAIDAMAQQNFETKIGQLFYPQNIRDAITNP